MSPKGAEGASMANNCSREDALSWQRGFEAARELERTLTRHEPVDPERSFRLALSLIEIVRRLGIWENEEERERSVSVVREKWLRLKQSLRP